MRNKIIICLSICVMAWLSGLSQTAKQPSIMVVPNEAWCLDNGYLTSYTDPISGISRQVPDYRKAVNDQELIIAIAKINEMFSERGFPLKNMQTVLQKLDRDRAATMVLNSSSGSSVQKSPWTELSEEAKADITLSITWIINQTGPKRSLAFTIQALDSYTAKQVGGASGTGPQSFSNEMSLLLQEAVLSHVDNLQGQMQEHFDDLRANGREISMRVIVWEDADYDLETECGDGEFVDVISDWLADNTVGGVFSESDVTESNMVLDDVRIPMFNDRGRAINARTFGRDLSKYLRSTCSDANDSGIKIMTRGLGEVWLVLGGK